MNKIGGTATFHPNEQFTINGTQIISRLKGNKCLTVDESTKLVSLAACDASLPATQHWTFKNGQLTAGGGLCLTAHEAPAPPPGPGSDVISIGRALAGGGAAIYVRFRTHRKSADTNCMTHCLLGADTQH